MDIASRIRAHFAESAELKLAAAEAMAPQIARAAALMTDCLLADGKLLACGNGGSASDAQHFAAELVGRFERERPELPAISLSTDTSLLAATAAAHEREMHVVALTGKGGGRLSELLAPSDVHICVPHTVTARIQEVHI